MSNPLKTIFTNKGSRAWAITTISAVALLSVVTGVATSRVLSGVLDMVFGGDRAVLKDGVENATSFELSEDIETGDKAATMEQSDDVTIEISKEGMTLLKNKNNALPCKTDGEVEKKISVFGKNSVNMAIAGSGSAGNAASGTVKDIYDSLDAAGYKVNPTLLDFYKKDKTERSKNPGMDAGGAATLEIGETPVSSYTDAVKASFSSYADMAVVVLTRIGGEGFDLPRAQPSDSTKTFLDLYPEERDMLNLVKSGGFARIVVVINAANQLNCAELEADDKVDAILWAGFPGSKGSMAIGQILNGTVNPSGHTVDTYVKDFKFIPSYHNFGDNSRTDGDRFIVDGAAKQYYFVDYEEDIYVGYRYFETGAATKGESWYGERVLYPFGYGLSYTSFEWSILSTGLAGKEITKDKFTVSVEVKNTGSVTGKEVVQLYMQAPYTDGGIEKSSKVLVGFAKTEDIEPQGTAKVDIEVDPYYFASYDAKDKNNNGFKGYELEQGAYTLYVAKNAHDSSNPINMSVTTGIQYTNDPVTDFKVENHFDGIDEHLQSEDILSRSDAMFDKDLTTLTPNEADRTISSDMFKKLKNTNWIDPANPIVSQENVTAPTFGAAGDMKLAQMIGKPFDDESWDALLDQVQLNEATDMFSDGGFHSLGIASITKPKTTDCDGPVGLTNFMGDPTVYDTVTFCCEVLTSSTWNVDLANKMGAAVGDEGIMGNVKGDKLPYTGWYAPGLNLHRNPFGGRCCEYFSEDPFLSGKMGASEVAGANSKGMITYMKHFVGNEGETHRDTNGCASYMTEQSLREIYLRTFEITVKEGKAKGAMTSFNRIGNYWTGANYSLCTTVLRNEWGFHGSIVTDFNTHSGSSGYMKLKPMLYAGGNLNLTSQPPAAEEYFDATSAKELTLLRNSTHEVLYAVANSNAMANEIDHMAWSYWKIGLASADGVAAAGMITWGVFALRPVLRRKP